jgi:hypothetical protein
VRRESRKGCNVLVDRTRERLSRVIQIEHIQHRMGATVLLYSRRVQIQSHYARPARL